MAADLRPRSIYMASVVVTWLFLLQMPQFTVAFIHIIQVQIKSLFSLHNPKPSDCAKSPFPLHDPKPSDCKVTILTARPKTV